MADKLNHEELEQQVKERERTVVESKQSKEFLQETEERFHILLAESRDGFYITGRGGRFIDANQALFRLLGYTREEMIGKLNLWDLYVFPHDRDKFKQEIEQKGFVTNHEVKLRKKNGSPVNCFLSAAIRRGNDGSIHGYRGTIRDSTEQKRAEKVPRSSEVHNLPIIMDLRELISERKRKEEEIQRSYQIQTVLNELLCVSLENISLEEMLEKFIDQVTSIPWLALESRGGIFLVRDDPEVLVMSAQRGLAKPLLKICAQVPFGRCLCGRAALSDQIVFADCMDERHENRYEGIFSHGHYCIPIISRAKKVLGVITLYLREGHRRNHREEEFLNAVANTLAGIIERKRLEEKLIKNEKLAAIGETAAGLAHCIKNILFGFEGGVYVVNKALKKDDKAKLNTGWGIVRRNIDKISNLVFDLLSYSKERTPECESVSPNAIADGACEIMGPKAKNAVAGGIEIIRDFDLNIGEGLFDRKGITQCLVDLISNAIDACRDDQNEDKRYLVKVSTRRERDGAVTFEVSDNGCGMDEALKKQALTIFFSTKGSKGTGLGLAITHKIVQEHGGTLSVNSKPGKGSVFTILLPGKERGG